MARISTHIAALVLLLPNAYLLADEARDREALRSQVEALNDNGFLVGGPVEIAATDLITDIYERRNFRANWTSPAKMADLLEAVRETEDVGLDPLDYHLEAVQRAYDDLVGGREFSSTERAVLELVLTDSLVRIGYHELFGKVNPQELDSNWNFERELRDEDPAATAQAIIDSPSVSDSLRRLVARGWLYEGLKAALADYRSIASRGGWPTVPAGPTLRPGAADDRLGVLARRLSISGDLDRVPEARPARFDEALVDAVKRFQERHGLDADGTIGPATLEALNVPAEARIRQLEISLERLRWIATGIDDEFILVNIAGYRAWVVRDREVVWETRVQVGRSYRQTPVFRDEIKYLVFNPTWTVPYSIATRDILPQLQQDTAYLTERNFEVRDRTGAVIDPATVDWASLNRGNFGYTLVQRPGPSNALGRVKFMFPNEHAVYLHDTPSRSLFERAERAFSSGCIRVEKPFELAEILLGADGWAQDRFREVLDGGEITTVYLSKPLPVLLLYWTAQVGRDGRVYFFNDIYDRDPAVAAALDQPFRLSGVTR